LEASDLEAESDGGSGPGEANCLCFSGLLLVCKLQAILRNSQVAEDELKNASLQARSEN